jgi:hypothetical protein
MPETTFQTVRLGRGKHQSPDHGVCVMELASMLSGEPFTDRPASVCRVVAAVLRGYNDIVDSPRRQDLYAAAADVLGSRSDAGVEARRLDHCVAAVADLESARRRSLRWRLLSRSPRHIRRLRKRAENNGGCIDHFGHAVARYLTGGGDVGHQRLMSLLPELVAIGGSTAVAPSLPPAPALPTPAG